MPAPLSPAPGIPVRAILDQPGRPEALRMGNRLPGRAPTFLAVCAPAGTD